MSLTPPVIPNMPYATIRAAIFDVSADGSDPGSYPDWYPLIGVKVQISPSIKGMLVYDPSGPDPKIIRLVDATGTINEDGLLVTDDGRPLFLPASNDPLMSVTGWTWTANILGTNIRFATPAGQEINLSDYLTAPQTDVTRYWIDRIPELIDAAGSLVSIQSVTSDSSDIIVTLTSGIQHRFPVPGAGTTTVPQDLSGGAGRFRGIYEVEPASLPNPQVGDYIIVLGEV